MKPIITMVTVGLVIVARSATVTFTPGGDAENPYELAAAANWSTAALPTKDDIAVINASGLDSAITKLTLSNNLEILGFRYENSDRLLVIASKDSAADPLPRLVLGEGGITNTATASASDKGLSFTIPLETTTAQTWYCGKQLFNTAAPIFGSEDLLIMRSYTVTHTKAPRYEGKITYRLSTYDWYQKVIICEAAKWAKAVVCQQDSEAGGSQYYQPTFKIAGEWKYSDLFPEGCSFISANWGTQTVLSDTTGTVATFDEDASARMTFNVPDSTHIKAGTVKLVSGNFLPGATFSIYNSGTFVQTGGRVFDEQGDALRIGAYQGESCNTASYSLQGGVVTNYTTAVGGMGGMSWYPSMFSIVRFNMSGGELVVLPGGYGYAVDQALSFSGVNEPGRSNGPGIFTQTGGRAIVNRVMFGSGHSDAKNTQKGFAGLNLNGGTFQIGYGNTATAGFVIGSKWNNEANSSTSNSYYKVRLGGGTLVTKSPTTKAQLEVAVSTASVFSNASDHVITAPVWGRGTLRKQGLGNLVFRDAARLTGSLVVEEGTATVGAYSDPAPAASPTADLELRAEDIVGIEDGGVVTAWTNQAKTVWATKVSTLAAPTFIKNGFVGRSALRFTAASKQALALPNANIPWLGKKTMGCAVVFKARTKGPDSNWDIYGWPVRGRGLLSTSASNDNGAYGTMFLSFTSDGAVAARYNSSGNTTTDSRAKCNINTRAPCDLDDDEVHIAIFSSDETNVKLRLMVDGRFYEITGLLDGALDSTRNLFIGAMNANDENRFFDGDIAEVKLYGSTLSRADMLAITEEWCAKYGTRPLVRDLFADGSAPGTGLGATNVAVAAGATLALPTGETAGYSVTAARALANSGTVSGTLAVTDGATLKLDWEHPAVFGTLQASGTVTLEIANIPVSATRPAKHTLFTYDALEGDATFVIKGDNVDLTNDSIVFDNGTCRYHTKHGAVLMLW